MNSAKKGLITKLLELRIYISLDRVITEMFYNLKISVK